MVMCLGVLAMTAATAALVIMSFAVVSVAAATAPLVIMSLAVLSVAAATAPLVIRLINIIMVVVTVTAVTRCLTLEKFRLIVLFRNFTLKRFFIVSLTAVTFRVMVFMTFFI